jgi:hypothetical protein
VSVRLEVAGKMILRNRCASVRVALSKSGIFAASSLVDHNVRSHRSVGRGHADREPTILSHGSTLNGSFRSQSAGRTFPNPG